MFRYCRSLNQPKSCLEAIAVGLNAIMRRQDAIITSHRMHSWVYLIGIEYNAIMAEMTGKKHGSTEGKGGSMHLHYSHKFFGGNGIVGDQVPVGAGVALAKQYLGGNGVCIVMYGDGAANQGQVFETFNMAKLWSLPCIFVCENNRYGKFTKIERSSANTKAYTRGDYIPGIWADGMDVLSVKEAGRYALNHCSSGNGPILLELDTYLYYSYSLTDPTINYRTREEIEDVRNRRDPIANFKESILKHNLVNLDELKGIELTVNQLAQEATKFAIADVDPDPETLTTHIYREQLEEKVRLVVPEMYS